MLQWQSLFLIAILFVLALSNPPTTASQPLEPDLEPTISNYSEVVKGENLTFTMTDKEYAEVRHLLNYLLQNARDNVMSDNASKASEEMKYAAFFMLMDARSDATALGTDVERAALEVADVADAITKSKTPTSIVDRVIRDSHIALARYHQKRAETLLDANFDRKAGYAIESALVHYRNGVMSKARLEDTPFDKVIDRELYSGLEMFSFAMQEDQAFSSSDAMGLLSELDTAIGKIM